MSLINPKFAYIPEQLGPHWWVFNIEKLNSDLPLGLSQRPKLNMGL